MWVQGGYFLDKRSMSFLRGAYQQTIPRFIPVGHNQAQQPIDVSRVAAEHSFSEIGLVTLERLENPE
ncbi:hypothetical protein AWB80_05230 [Caballeronia pedi]|uniref:Uncharacterized protein n=1 Tax=Caballeronia pedi TaxID=1777141 RepID=A0A158CH38_9BURK|nr:hypothetical protein AWB80_05230 [Caballeronia pedi]